MKSILPTDAPRVGFVSLGCPKATVDSEHILTRLRAEGYEISASYDDADLVVVNTCGFIDAAVEDCNGLPGPIQVGQPRLIGLDDRHAA